MRIMRPIVSLLALAGSATPAATAAAPARPAGDRVVERTVMLMRHGVRPSTKFPATPVGTTREAWPDWTTPAGDLTAHGAEAVRRLAAYDRTLFAAAGLLPAQGCAPAGTVTAWASGSSRAIKTGKAFLETIQPGCGVPLDHPAGEEDEDAFHPSDARSGIDGAIALKAAEAMLPAGGIEAEVKAHEAEFRLLERATGVPVRRDTTLKASPGDKPNLKGGLSFGSTASQTILLEYLEGMPMRNVGWGRASRADIRAMLRFHPVKFRFETRPAYVAQRLAAPLVGRMVDALSGKGGALTLLFGHDTNIAALGGFYGLHWTMADYPADDIAPGGAIGFELLRDRSGHRTVRAFSQAQYMDQVRNLTALDKAHAPSRTYLAIPGCGPATTGCDLATFERLTRERLARPAQS
jgi:4-phytase / acid phosphatase